MDLKSIAREHVKFFYNHGFYVIPCFDGRDKYWNESWERFKATGDKHYIQRLKQPLIKFRGNRPRRDLQELEYFLGRTQMFGLRTGDPLRCPDGKTRYLTVIDCDNKDPKQKGVENVKKEFGIQDGMTFTVATPTGDGRHYYFVSDEPLPSCTNLIPNVDVRGYPNGVIYMPGTNYVKDGKVCRYRALTHDFVMAQIPENIEHQIKICKRHDDVQREINDLDTLPDDFFTNMTKYFKKADKNIKDENTEDENRGRATRIQLPDNLFDPDIPALEAEIVQEPLDGIIDSEIARTRLLATAQIIRSTMMGQRNNSLYWHGCFVFSFVPRYISEEKACTLLAKSTMLPADEAQATIASAMKSRRAQDKYWVKDDPEYYKEYILKVGKKKLEAKRAKEMQEETQEQASPSM